MFNPQQIKRIIRENNLHINKSLGQNFLVDENIRDRIVSFCDIKKEDIILEIGPGLGALTENVAPLCKRIIAVEKDRGLAVLLRKILTDCSNLDLLNQDILRYDISALSKLHKKIKVIGNLPFYITSPILFYLIESRQYIDSIFVTVQKEVAQRIVSHPGTKDYGIPSCSMQYYMQPFIRMQIPKNFFYPRPEVDASFVELKIRKEPAVKVKDEELFFKIIKAAFNQRRKTLFNALSKNPLIKIDKDTLTQAFERLNLNFRLRGESLSLQQFGLLSDTIAGISKK